MYKIKKAFFNWKIIKLVIMGQDTTPTETSLSIVF